MATAAPPSEVVGEQRFFLDSVDWDQYVSIADALPDKSGLRIVYTDRSLTLLTTSRRHDWHVRVLADLVTAVANAQGIPLEIAGTATFRDEELQVGAEGDATFYFGEHAVLMQGPVEIDLSTQPPPDLVVEVEVTHPADRAMIAWSRLRVPEVWRLDVPRKTLSFWALTREGSYREVSSSVNLAGLAPKELVDQIDAAEREGLWVWKRHVDDWAARRSTPRVD